jgi:hypothetical protein
MFILELLEEQKKRAQLKEQILESVLLAYSYGDGITQADPLCRWVGLQLNIPVSRKLRKQIKSILFDKGCGIQMREGRAFYTGLIAIDPEKDECKVKELLQLHYRCRATYAAKQRAHTMKRYT